MTYALPSKLPIALRWVAILALFLPFGVHHMRSDEAGTTDWASVAARGLPLIAIPSPSRRTAVRSAIHGNFALNRDALQVAAPIGIIAKKGAINLVRSSPGRFAVPNGLVVESSAL
jgi:hypothetical protein